MNSNNPQILSLIQNYKSYISKTKMQDEVYKWELLKKFKGRPDTNAEDFATEYKAIKFGNLLYQLGSAVGNHICKENPEEFRQLFVYLFDETIPLNKRVSYFNSESLKIYRSMGETLGHHQDERSISTYLTLHNPEKYTFYKSTFYKEFCKLLGVAPAGKNEKYGHYLELINQFIENYIVPDAELTNTVKSYLPEYYDGKNNMLLAQDILYCMLNKAPVEKINYWRIGTKDDEDDYWEMMKSDNVICIGWPNLGNLDDTEIENKKDVDELLHTKGSYVNDNRNRSRKALEIFNFFKTAKEGDVVLAQSGHTVLGIGIVKDEYSYEIKSGFPHQRNVEWLKIFAHGEFKNEEGSQTTFVPLTGSDLLTKIKFYLSGDAPKLNSLKQNTMTINLNQILYGPPGTGKTYNTIDKAVSIISPKEFIEGNHNSNKLVYDKLYKRKNVMFTTFHQSMSYEDFIEGIKPKLNDESDSESEEITYEISSGIFKLACARAAYNAYIENRTATKKSNSFEDVFEAYLEMARNKIVEGNFLTCKTITGKEVEIYKVNKNDSIKARSKGSVATHVAPLTKENIQKLYDTFESVSDIKSLQQIKEAVGVTPRITEFYAVFKSILDFKETKFEPIKDEELVEKELSDEELVRQFDSGLYNKALKEHGLTSTPVVLVIDEINRGNVSAIFGELITLIEADKRVGQANEIRLSLPYSKNEFSVPPNLYIIGTMNTADRSVEALDTALRRRFSFEEMLPKPELLKDKGENGSGKVGEINLEELLKTINERIEALVDRDHTIGHAFFMEVTSIDSLRNVFANKVIPLLQEYFYGDYAKMEMVIGSDFFNSEKRKKKVIFAIQNEDVEIPTGSYELMNVLDQNFQFEEAIIRLISSK